MIDEGMSGDVSRVTIQDKLSHRTGMPRHDDFSGVQRK